MLPVVLITYSGPVPGIRLNLAPHESRSALLVEAYVHARDLCFLPLFQRGLLFGLFALRILFWLWLTINSSAFFISSGNFSASHGPSSSLACSPPAREDKLLIIYHRMIDLVDTL
jgi:hypothetical protein